MSSIGSRFLEVAATVPELAIDGEPQIGRD
jgi:hypothetical protein